MGHDSTVQERIPVGEERIIGALYDRGDALAVLQHRQVRGTSYVGSRGACRESVAVPGLESAVRDPLDELDWHGLACIEYIGDADTGEFVLVEVNPRMWQSLAGAVAVGANFPETTGDRRRAARRRSIRHTRREWAVTGSGVSCSTH